jgi:hypothetical protein
METCLQSLSELMEICHIICKNQALVYPAPYSMEKNEIQWEETSNPGTMKPFNYFLYAQATADTGSVAFLYDNAKALPKKPLSVAEMLEYSLGEMEDLQRSSYIKSHDLMLKTCQQLAPYLTSQDEALSNILNHVVERLSGDKFELASNANRKERLN